MALAGRTEGPLAFPGSSGIMASASRRPKHRYNDNTAGTRMSEPTEELKQAKRELRRAVIARRDALSATNRAEAGRLIRSRLMALPVVQAAGSVFCFISYASEVDTHPVIDTLLEAGRRVASPKIIDKTTMLAIPIDSREGLQPDRMGILTPIGDEPDPGPFDVAIVPGVAFTEHCERLGYGRGYYDRWLARHNVDVKIAVAFEAQIVDAIPTDETDLPVDMIVTERRLIRRKPC